ncbi:PREDICTED: protein FD [Prunus mume]|uniref:Protein FD n=1 Tax=Prunus mume TaxID=102107 RepID=A0ABM0N8X8_PRUMU|nr:PREDICTED: protein FD [Prunus mume]
MIPTTTTSPRSLKSMEDVWKDISLASLSHANDLHGHCPPAAAAAFRGMIFQDFFATCASSNKDRGRPPPQPTIAAPATVLSLNSDIQLLPESTTSTAPAPLLKHPVNPQLLRTSHAATPSFHFLNSSSCSDALDSSSLFHVPSYYNKRRRPIDHHHHHQSNDQNSRDRRHKRMIKNRESAARSRARKQAYTTELELELTHLQKENARLKTQQAEFLLAAPALAQLPTTKRHTLTLFRSSTAPF